MYVWNPWHGCRKISPGCQHCYVYRIDAEHGRDASRVITTRAFNLPLRRSRKKTWKIPSGTQVYTCFSSDFFIEEADAWREEIWEMIRLRQDLHFFIITKRIHRAADCLPPRWNAGFTNVTLCATCENQEQADYRLPFLKALPLLRRGIVCEPLLGPLDVTPYLDATIHTVIAGGESGPDARICHHDWVLNLRRQCEQARVPFHFHQTGARYHKDGHLYSIPRHLQQEQARKSRLDWPASLPFR